MATVNLVLEVDRRNETGKNHCRRLRASGRIPGNVYGLDRKPFMVAVDPKRIDDVLRTGSGMNSIFKLALSGEERTREAMIRELQRDPVSERPVHIDFVRVDPKRVIHVGVPVRLLGTPEGVKNEGGIIDFVHREIQLECLPGDIPEHLDVDVSELHINQHVAIKDVTLPELVTVLDDVEQILAVVVAPKVDEEPTEAEEGVEAAAEGAEPAEGKEADAEAESGGKEKGKEKGKES